MPRKNPNFKIRIRSSSLDNDLVLHVRDCSIIVNPAGPYMTHQNDSIKLSGIVRASGKLEVRACKADWKSSVELGAPVVLETDPVQDPSDFLNRKPHQRRDKAAKERRDNVLNGGQAGGRSKVTERTISSLLSKKESK